jgi:type VI secretion system protein ImpA
MAAWAEMSRVLDEKANDVSPSFTRVRDLLQLLLDTCNRFAPDAGVATDIAMAAPSAGPNQATSMAVAPGAVTAGGIAGREQALSQLAEIAAWFKRNEPQSPIAYTLDEAVRRGRMSWPDLLDEVMSDETARNALLSSLGIKPKGYGE